MVALGTLLWGIARQPVKVEGDSDGSLPRSVEVSGFVGRFVLTLPVAEIGFLQEKKLPPTPQKKTKIKRLSHWQSKVCLILFKRKIREKTFSFFWWMEFIATFLGSPSFQKTPIQ